MKLLFVSCVMAGAVWGADLEWKDLGGGRLQLLDRGKPALVYNYGPQLPEGVPEDRRRSSYVYPIYTPGGTSVTFDFPKDHYHHRGVFWAWPVVEARGKRFDLWMMRGGIENRFERWVEKKASGREAVLAVENGWWADGAKIVRETVRLRAMAAQGARRVLEVTLTLEPLGGPVTLKGSQERGKGYGGLSVRFADRAGTAITADTGKVAKDEDLVPHAWAALTGVYEGGKKASLRVDSMEGNPGGNPVWCLRNYGFIGASYPGQAGVTIEKPVTLRYRVTLEDLPE